MSTISYMANNTYMMYKFAAKAGLSPAADRVFQLDRGNGGGPQLTDHHARRAGARR